MAVVGTQQPAQDAYPAKRPRKRPAGRRWLWLTVLVLLVAAAAGGWLWWRGRQQAAAAQTAYETILVTPAAII